MGVKRSVVFHISCDICGAECGGDGDSGVIRHEVNGGDGRDVGPAYVYGEIKFFQPYGCDKGIVCEKCKMKYLAAYLAERSSQPATRPEGE